MSLYHVLGSELVPQEQALDTARKSVGLESIQLPVPGVADIGSGKPLSIIVRHLYTGRFPKSSAFSSRKDFLLTSAVRDVFAGFNAAPRAVNMMRQKIPSRTNISGIDAVESGTQLVCYSPAVTSVSTTATIEMAFDDYPDALVSRIGSAITSAAGIPLFGPYGPVMIGVGLAIKLVSSAINALTDAQPEFSVSERLEFELPDGGPIPAGYRVLCQQTFDPTPLTFKLGTGLVDAKNRPYDGDEPYVVLLLDGTQRDAFKDFMPTAATAALLGRFLQQQEGSDIVINTIVDAVKLYGDVRNRRDADQLQQQLAGLDPKSAEYARIKTRIDALLANIGEQLLKPKA